jgi:hypothetical protein
MLMDGIKTPPVFVDEFKGQYDSEEDESSVHSTPMFNRHMK